MSNISSYTDAGRFPRMLLWMASISHKKCYLMFTIMQKSINYGPYMTPWEYSHKQLASRQWHPSNIHTIIVIYVIMYVIICLHIYIYIYIYIYIQGVYIYIQAGDETQSMLSQPEYAVVCVVKSNRNVLLPGCAIHTYRNIFVKYNL